MNCTSFRENHGAFLDDVLDEQELVAMQCHLAECRECAAFDTQVRRALLIFRNLPPITPSADFGERLHARLIQERRTVARALATPRVAARGPGLGVFAAAAASVAAIGYLAAASVAPHAPRELALPPVVATRLAEPAPVVAESSARDTFVSPSVSSPALMASVSAAMPIWPTTMLVDQAPLHFASSEFQYTSFGR